MQIRLSTSGASTNVGTTPTSVGNFGALLLDINPNLNPAGPGGYTLPWTQFTVTLPSTDVPSPTTGRFAFRYFVPNSSAANGPADVVGLDDVVVSAVPEPTSLALAGLAVAAAGVWRRRRRAKRQAMSHLG